MIQDHFRNRDQVLFSSMELGNMEAIKELVKLNLGVSILASWIAQKELGEKSLVTLPLGRKKLLRKWGILHWKDHRLSLAEDTFVGLCNPSPNDSNVVTFRRTDISSPRITRFGAIHSSTRELKTLSKLLSRCAKSETGDR
jgi:hypothetical protein